jgi:hypothetical protein
MDINDDGVLKYASSECRCQERVEIYLHYHICLLYVPNKYQGQVYRTLELAWRVWREEGEV